MSRRPARVRDRLHHRLLVWLLLRGCALLAFLPEFLAYAIADLMAVPFALHWTFADRKGRRTKGYHRNARIVFRPGSPLPERPRRHLWRWSRHLAWLVVDFCRARRIHPGNLDRHVDTSEVPQLRELMARGQGVIVATGHVGMWDIAGHAAGLVGIPLTSVFRSSHIPALDRGIERLRGSTGQSLLVREGAIWPLKKALGEGKMLGLLVDGGSKGSRTFAPFLGTMAACTPTPALLQHATGAPVVVLSCQRTGRMRFRVRLWDVIEAVEGEDRSACLQRVSARVNDGLTRAIVAAPEQWFWQGNRFRHRPPGEVEGPDGLPPLAG